ncbi:MAG: Asp-tRNA(Asn)/Glu-tRNA(Gln) amidotransferase subunit GatC [Leptospira sp.]|nr:Asp-tRNA(Asn)/Glu-tRNA(Gln) amidotransferase subunit GatC [Leptospira sp.]
MDLETLKNIAGLARLKVKEEEAQGFLNDFNKVLDYVDQVKSLDTSSIAEDSVYAVQENITRRDEVENTLTRDDLSSIAPDYENGYIVVPKVIET